MNEQMKLISSRIVELREILNISSDEIAKKLNLNEADYLKYEKAEADMPISVLYGVADILNVDPTLLMSGESPKMNNYTVVRNGNGITVERYEGYSFSSLAFNYIGREMEPMIVTLKRDNAIQKFVAHNGQEFNYILEGEVKVVIGEKEFILKTGDSIFFNPKVLHAQYAITKIAKFLTVINEKNSLNID